MLRIRGPRWRKNVGLRLNTIVIRACDRLLRRNIRVLIMRRMILLFICLLLLLLKLKVVE